MPQAFEPIFQHVVTTYASETNKTVSMWRAVPDSLLDFKPHMIRTIMVHQLLSERRFFGQFVGAGAIVAAVAGHEPVSAIYGASGDVKWDEADPTYSLEAAKRGG